MRTLKDVLPKHLPAEWQLVRQDKKHALFNQVVLKISEPTHNSRLPFVQNLSCQELGCDPDYGRMTSRPGLCVAVRAPEHMNGRDWMHVVVTVAPVAGNLHPSSYPLINDLEEVRKLFLGKDKTATLLLKSEQNLPPEEKPFQVHLWAELS